MNKVILLSELNFNSCLAHFFVNNQAWKNYTIQVSFVPEPELNQVILQAAPKYDLIISIGYQNQLFTEDLLAAYPGKLILLAHRNDEQGGKFIPILFNQSFDTETILLTENILEIFNDQIAQGIFLDLNASWPTVDPDEDTKYLLYLRKRYLQALKIVETFYGQAEKIKFHQIFLLELVGGDADYYWIDEIIQNHNLADEKPSMLPLNFN